MSIALAIEDLTVVRGGRVVLDALSFDLAGGSVLALEGPNGSGKTTLLRAIAGLLSPVSGRISITRNGAEVTDPEERGSAIGWLGHQDGIKAQLTVAEQATFWAEVYGSTQDVGVVLKRFGLAALAELRGVALSAGQKRRLAFARLALTARPVWLLDEPLAALDVAGKALVAEAITAKAAAGDLVVAATHEPLGVACRRLVLGAG